MPSSYIDIKSSAVAYPYVLPKSIAVSQAASTAVTEAAAEAKAIEEAASQPPSTVPGTPGTEWKRVTLATPDISNVTEFFQGITEALDKFVAFLTPIFDIIQLYISTFGSFAKLFSSLISIIQDTLDGFTKGLGQAGVYANVIVPPAFVQANLSNIDLSRLGCGGFQGFITRLQMSLNDTTDDKRPTFGSTASVGGLVFVVDSESLDEVFTGLKQLAAIFNDLMKAFGLNISPPPPVNVRGRCGYFTKIEKVNGKTKKNTKESTKYAIKIEWDKPPGFAFNYAIARSREPGGVPTAVPYVPTELTGKDGLFSMFWRLLLKIFAKEPFAWPEKVVPVYNDPDFNGGKPAFVPRDPATGGGSYIDYVDTLVDTSGPITKPIEGTTPKQLYYVVYSALGTPNMSPSSEDLASGALPGIGPKSSEASVVLKFCDDATEATGAIEQPEGFFEFMGPGWNNIGKWTTIQITSTIPYVTEVVKIINTWLEQFKGMAVDASDSFAEFLKQIKDKITMYIDMAKLLSRMATELSKFVIGSSVAMLYLPPKTGGINTFMTRVKNAKVPSGQSSFSGPTGVTAGIVLMFGYDSQLSGPGREAINAQFVAIDKAFGLIKELFGG